MTNPQYLLKYHTDKEFADFFDPVHYSKTQ